MNKPPNQLPGSGERKALELFHQGYNCAQSVFAAFAPIAGMNEAFALKLASPFGAGIGRMREVCGAFCGLSMIAGICRGNETPDINDKERIFSLVQELAASFKNEFGTISCRELLHLTEESKEKETARPSERTRSYYDSRPCERCIARCAAMAEQLIEEGL